MKYVLIFIFYIAICIGCNNSSNTTKHGNFNDNRDTTRKYIIHNFLKGRSFKLVYHEEWVGNGPDGATWSKIFSKDNTVLLLDMLGGIEQNPKLAEGDISRRLLNCMFSVDDQGRYSYSGQDSYSGQGVIINGQINDDSCKWLNHPNSDSFFNCSYRQEDDYVTVPISIIELNSSFETDIRFLVYLFKGKKTFTFDNKKYTIENGIAFEGNKELYLFETLDNEKSTQASSIYAESGSSSSSGFESTKSTSDNDAEILKGLETLNETQTKIYNEAFKGEEEDPEIMTNPCRMYRHRLGTLNSYKILHQLYESFFEKYPNITNHNILARKSSFENGLNNTIRVMEEKVFLAKQACD